MSYPTLTIEVETSTGIWTNYSTRMRAVKTKRGKRRAIDMPTAGVANVTLANEDRALDPEHAASLVRVGQNIRIKSVWNAVTYSLFTGTIDRIIQRYGQPRGAVTEFECTDGTADLERARLISVWEVTQKKIAKHQYLRFGEASGNIAADSSGNGRYAMVQPYVTMGDNGLQFGDPDSAYKFDSTGYVLLLPGSFPALIPYAINFTLNMPPPAVDTHLFYDVEYPNGLRFWVDTLGRLNVQCVSNGVQTAYARTANAVTGNSKQICIVFEAGQPIKIWNTGTWDNVAQSGTGGASVQSKYHVLGYLSNAIIDEWYITPHAPSAAELQSLMDANPGGWYLDTLTKRVERVLEAIGWDLANWELLGSATSLLLPTVLGETALEHLQSLMDTFEATLYVTAGGKLRIIARGYRDSQPFADSKGTFGDGIGELGYVGMEGYSLDTELVTNIVRRYNLDSVTMAVDNASIAKYGPRDQTDQAEVDSLLADPSQDFNLAQYRLAHLSEALPSLDDLVLMPAKSPATHWPQALGRELAERITLIRRPQNVGAAIQREMIIEGIEHDIAPKKWVTTFNIDATNALRFFQFDVTLWDSSDWRFQ